MTTSEIAVKAWPHIKTAARFVRNVTVKRMLKQDWEALFMLEAISQAHKDGLLRIEIDLIQSDRDRYFAIEQALRDLRVALDMCIIKGLH